MGKQWETHLLVYLDESKPNLVQQQILKQCFMSSPAFQETQHLHMHLDGSL